MNSPKVLYVCSEVYPLLKTGGLADVSAGLPPALAAAGAEVRLLLPAFPSVVAGVTPEGPTLPVPAGGIAGWPAGLGPQPDTAHGPAPWLQRGEPFLLVSFGFAVWGTRCFCSARRSQTHAHAGSWLNPKTVPGPHNARPDPAHQVGPEGCGKGALLRHAFARLRRGGPLAIAEIHCSAATGAGQIIDKLVQVRTFL